MQCRQVELWNEIKGLLEQALSGNGPVSKGAELPAAAALREYEEALKELRKVRRPGDNESL